MLAVMQPGLVYNLMVKLGILIQLTRFACKNLQVVEIDCKFYYFNSTGGLITNGWYIVQQVLGHGQLDGWKHMPNVSGSILIPERTSSSYVSGTIQVSGTSVTLMI